jgi:curved DNA-binding protein CbpA
VKGQAVWRDEVDAIAQRRYLDLLRLPSSFTADELKEAYRDMSRVWHPDRYPADSRLRRKAEEIFKEINAANQYFRKNLENGHFTFRDPTSSSEQDQSRTSAGIQKIMDEVRRETARKYEGEIRAVLGGHAAQLDALEDRYRSHIHEVRAHCQVQVSRLTSRLNAISEELQREKAECTRLRKLL